MLRNCQKRQKVKRSFVLSILLLFTSLIYMPFTSNAHFAIMINVFTTLSIDHGSINVSYSIECGEGTAFDLRRLIDKNKDNNIEPSELKDFNHSIEKRLKELKSFGQISLDDKPLALIPQSIAIDSREKGKLLLTIYMNSDRFLHNESKHVLNIAYDLCPFDFELLYSIIDLLFPQAVDTARIMQLTVEGKEKIRILSASKGIKGEDGTVKGIFLNKNNKDVQITFQSS